MTEYNIGFELGANVVKSMSLNRYLPGGDDYEALVYAPYQCFAEYEPSDDMILRGKVRRIGHIKWVAQNDLRLDREPSAQNGWKPFRSRADEDWMREEYCLKGVIRGYPTLQDKKYRAKYNVDSATPPPNDTQSWEEVE